MARGTILGVAVTTVLAAAGSVHAQWTATNLNPNLGPETGAWWSTAAGVSGTQQVGIVNYSVYYGHAIPVASYWNGTAGSWVNLSPGTASAALATNGTQQVGYRSNRASMWSGTAASWVDLHQSWSPASSATAISGSQQGGNVFQVVGGNWKSRASLWSGTAASWVNLHPTTGVTDSWVTGMAGSQQVGYTTWDNVHHSRAALWHGTAASYVSLHPTGYRDSQATATSGTHQVGWVNFWAARHASMWSGSANSFVNLNPAGATESIANSLSGEYQAGWANVGGVQRASLWNGTAESWLDLHQFLPGGAGAWRWSEAKSVWTDGNWIRVAGFANSLTGQNVAMLWEFEHPLNMIPLPTGAGLAFAGLGLMAVRRRTRG